MKDGCQYTADYFLRGKQMGLSLYEDYRWMPELTVPMAHAIVNGLGIGREDVVLDFGCSRGYLVKALRLLGYRNSFGVDASPWAVENCDPDVRGFVSLGTEVKGEYDWIIAKDVLEHVESLPQTINGILDRAKIGVFVAIPLGGEEWYKGKDWSGLRSTNKYVIAEYEKDVTHVWRLVLSQWASLFMRPGWSVEASYSFHGCKDNWYRDGWEKGNGFITARRQR